jgi:hypothetical protein
MNLRVLLLAGLTAVNGGLITAFLLRPSLAPGGVQRLLPALTSRPGEPGPRAANSRVAPAARNDSPPATELWQSLHSTDLATLVQRLRSAGFPPAMVRAIADAEVERQFSPRIKELMKTSTETPYWRADPGYYSGNPKLFESVSQIYRERSRVLRDLLGKDAYAVSGVDPTTAQRRQYGNLSPAKIDLVQRITEDYAEMTGQIRSAMQGVTLPEDVEKLALLEREKRTDLSAVLTPEELAEYEMRTSPITSRLRTALTMMDASEAEFRSIYRAHEPFKEVLYPTSTGGMIFITSEVTEKRREAARQIQEKLKTDLGDSRFAQYQRASDNDFQQLYRLGQRDNIPYDILVRAHDVRGPTAEASLKIVDNAALSSDAKQAALKELAQNARTSLLSTLGPSAGPSYVENSRWLTYLDQGRGFSVGPDGSMSSRSVPMRPPPGTPTPTR